MNKNSSFINNNKHEICIDLTEKVNFRKQNLKSVTHRHIIYSNSNSDIYSNTFTTNLKSKE